MRQLGVVIVVAVLAMFASPVLARAQENIYADELAATQQSLERAEHRVEVAAARILNVQAELPPARRLAARLRQVSDRRQHAAEDALKTVEAAEDAVRYRRARAQALVRRTRVGVAHAIDGWRGRRAAWVSITVSLLAAASSLVLLALFARYPSDAREQSAVRISAELGGAVAVYLCGLILALWWADAWRFSWWAVSAAVSGVAVLIIAVGTGSASARLLESPRRRRVVAGSVAALACGALLAVLMATGMDRPRAAPLPAGTLTLVHQAVMGAPMPSEVQALRSRSDALKRRALDADAAAARARHAHANLKRSYAKALTANENAQASVEALSDAVDLLQREYNNYQELLTPSYDIPAYGTPTTQDFGSGLGTVGLCADGTLSDSIGRPGACSHHGGVG